MIWVWLAIIASFAWHFYAGYGNENELLKLARAHGALLKHVRLLNEEVRCEIAKLQDQVEPIRKHLGYEELDYCLGQNVVWGENRKRALMSIFPRVADIEFRMGLLDEEVKAAQTQGIK